jgi:hypothetical protein
LLILLLLNILEYTVVNEFPEKASQSVVIDLDKDNTVGVFVNDKSKLVDTDKNKFTHFMEMLLRSDTIRV